MNEENKLYKALKEVSVVLQYTDPALRSKVPKNFAWFMENYKDESHYFKIRLDIPVQEQNLMYESMVMLSIILKSSWYDKKTLKRIQKVYKVSEQQFMQDREMSARQLDAEINALTIIKKENIFKRFFRNIKRFFGFNRGRIYMPD